WTRLAGCGWHPRSPASSRCSSPPPSSTMCPPSSRRTPCASRPARSWRRKRANNEPRQTGGPEQRGHPERAVGVEVGLSAVSTGLRRWLLAILRRATTCAARARLQLTIRQRARPRGPGFRRRRAHLAARLELAARAIGTARILERGGRCRDGRALRPGRYRGRRADGSLRLDGLGDTVAHHARADRDEHREPVSGCRYHSGAVRRAGCSLVEKRPQINSRAWSARYLRLTGQKRSPEQNKVPRGAIWPL